MQKPTGENEQSFLCEATFISNPLCSVPNTVSQPILRSQSPLSTLPFAVGSEVAAEGQSRAYSAGEGSSALGTGPNSSLSRSHVLCKGNA